METNQDHLLKIIAGLQADLKASEEKNHELRSQIVQLFVRNSVTPNISITVTESTGDRVESDVETDEDGDDEDFTWEKFVELKKDDNISQKTLNSYYTTLRKTYRFIRNNKFEMPNDLRWIWTMNREKIHESMCMLGNSIATQSKQLHVFKSVCKAFGWIYTSNMFEEKINQLDAEIKATNEDNPQKMTEKQKEHFIEWEDFTKIVQKAKEEADAVQFGKKRSQMTKYFNTKQKAFVLEFHHTYPLRCDLTKATFDEKVDEGNYLTKDEDGNWIFHLEDYKTDKRYGEKEYILPKDGFLANWCDEVHQMYITEDNKLTHCVWGDIQNENGKKYLLRNQSGSPFLDDNYFGKYFQRIMKKWTGKPIGVTNIRTSKVTDKHKNDTSLAERAKLANIMCHSIATQQQCYEKK